jgi:hypothetical protein
MTRNRDTTERTAREQTTETKHSATGLDESVDDATTSFQTGDTTIRVKVPDEASPAEADAIVAAVREHLDAAGRFADGDEEPRRWIEAHRLQGVEPGARALLNNTDADPWVAASRANQRW